MTTWRQRFQRAPMRVQEPRETDAWSRHVRTLDAAGIPEPGNTGSCPHATLNDEQALYDVAPSFVDILPWVEYLPQSQSLLLEDGVSVAAFFELVPVGTEGRELHWLAQVRDSLENALQDSFDELDENPWVVQLYAQDETDWDSYLETLHGYIQPRARDTAFSNFYERFFAHHLRAIAAPGGLFEDTTVTRLPWRGQQRRVRMVVYRRTSATPERRGQSPSMP
ncbi:TPA: TraC family protein [Serratia marcescens]